MTDLSFMQILLDADDEPDADNEPDAEDEPDHEENFETGESEIGQSLEEGF